MLSVQDNKYVHLNEQWSDQQLSKIYHFHDDIDSKNPARLIKCNPICKERMNLFLKTTKM